MKHMYQIADEFFESPISTRTRVDEMEHVDVVADDGVTYPNIVDLEATPEGHDFVRRIKVFYPDAQPTKVFARYTYESERPPHWAHSDKEMTQMIAMCNLHKHNYNETLLLTHNEYEFNTHPKTKVEKLALIDDSNDFRKWNIDHAIKLHNNQCLFLNADYIHAAGIGFGRTRVSARLMMTCFFNVESTD